MYYDTVIIGCGVGGLYAAANLPREEKILMICKEDMDSCDSMLAQGGICVLRDESDYDSYFEDTMRAGHYENRKESVDIMIRSSRSVINDLIRLGVRFDRNPDGSLCYTKEGAHSKPRICFHEDITGKEITETLRRHVLSLANVTIREYTTMTDILENEGICTGIEAKTAEGEKLLIHAGSTILATGGIGGLYEHSTNFPSLPETRSKSPETTESGSIIWITCRFIRPACTVRRPAEAPDFRVGERRGRRSSEQQASVSRTSCRRGILSPRRFSRR